MSEYKYISPLEKYSCRKIEISKQEHNVLFPHLKFNMFMKCDYYMTDYGISVEVFTNKFGIFVNTLFLPVSILMNGLCNTKEIIIELKQLYNQKKYGKFISDYICNDYKSYKNWVELCKTLRSE